VHTNSFLFSTYLSLYFILLLQIIEFILATSDALVTFFIYIYIYIYI